MQKYSVRS